MAWVRLSEGNVRGKDFKDWVNQYLLPDSSLRCTADDLYGARCGLVHSHTAESDSTNKGAARQIWYYGKEASKELLEQQIGNRTDVIAVRIVDLIDAFSNGSVRYIKDLALDSQRSKKALERASHWIGWVDPERVITLASRGA